MRLPIPQIVDPGIPSMARLLLDLRRAGRERPEESAKRRKALLDRLVESARALSPFYRKRYAHLPGEIRHLRELPQVAKSELMANFNAWATDPAITRETADAFVADPSRIGQLYLGRYVAFSTSGTTGTPAVLLQDRRAMAVYQALLLGRRIPSLLSAGGLVPFLRNRARTATIIATGGHFASSVVDARVRAVYPRLHGFNRTFSLMEPIPDLVRALNEFQPAVVGSYPTALAVLAEEKAAGRLRIDPVLLLAGAERLSPPLAARISGSFRCPVRDTYAASEFMGIAFDCRHGRLHVNADWVILEPVDASGEPVPPDEPSRTTLLTNLANRLQPLIRYDLGDSVTMIPGSCPCGSPLPCIRPEGRCDEILRVELPDGTSRPLLPLVLATVAEETGGLLRYQLLQAGPRALKLRVEEAPGHDRGRVCAEALRRLRAYLSSQGLESVSLDLSGERPQPGDAAGGKSRQFLVERSGPGSRGVS
ncbi:MAG: phenylacetate--CoA ligase family protein [Deltaproteobacteria bacterium]|nr:phenylacetate--CoA ligase family protein [Deltaproteobacteria bacterium]